METAPNTTTTTTTDTISRFLSSVYPLGFPPRSDPFPSDLLRHNPPSSLTPEEPGRGRERPFVTLTFAQSLDAKIAGREGKQLKLSGGESMEMTHRLRLMHDAILVGVGTMKTDDPRLNVRLPHILPKPPPTSSQPQPIVIDPNLESSPTCKLIVNAKGGDGKTPWFVVRRLDGGEVDSDVREGRVRWLEATEGSARLVEVDVDDTGRINFPSLLSHLSTLGISSLMVEGGSKIIHSLLTTSPALFDLLVITIAPTIVGDEGVSVSGAGSGHGHGEVGLDWVGNAAMGRDSVIVCRPRFVDVGGLSPI